MKTGQVSFLCSIVTDPLLIFFNVSKEKSLDFKNFKILFEKLLNVPYLY